MDGADVPLLLLCIACAAAVPGSVAVAEIARELLPATGWPGALERV
jgi:hypothetical protein